MIELEKTIDYSFKNKSFLKTALTHSSYANENKMDYYNERLEFLGDSVLGIVVSDHLFVNNPNLPEGKLTKTRARIVCETSLEKTSRSIDLGDYLLLGKGEELTGGRNRTSILADAFEALIAAIYLDGGFEQARYFILCRMKSIIDEAVNGKLFIDYKTHLQELIQKRSSGPLNYQIYREEGPDHAKVFFSSVTVNETEIGKGKGNNKKEAEQEAAQMALVDLLKNNRNEK
ncbi:MAG: ribonuclease III [Peptostreptococcaceae bacterium]|nr:ribonuclease III [Peptostreptococcaceae bacterium]